MIRDCSRPCSWPVALFAITLRNPARLQKVPVFHLAGLAEGGEGFQNLLNAGAAGGFETRRDLLRRLEWGGAQRVLDDAELVCERSWPGLFAAGSERSFHGDEAAQGEQAVRFGQLQADAAILCSADARVGCTARVTLPELPAGIAVVAVCPLGPFEQGEIRHIERPGERVPVLQDLA